MNQIESKSGTVVLLVDEDLEYLESMRRNIQRSGYSVTVCKSYDEGIHQLASGAFDIIFVGQGSRKFEGRCVLSLRRRLTGIYPLWWWRASSIWGVIWRRCNWCRRLHLARPLGIGNRLGRANSWSPSRIAIRKRSTGALKHPYDFSQAGGVTSRGINISNAAGQVDRDAPGILPSTLDGSSGQFPFACLGGHYASP